MQCDPIVRRLAASAGWAPSKGTRRPEPAALRRKGQHRCFLAAPGTRDSASGPGSPLAEIAQIPGERLALASAASRRLATRAHVHASAVARIGESLAGTAGTAETPGEASERIALASAAPLRPAARAGAHASAAARIGKSLAGTAETPGEATERIALASAAPLRPAARAGAHASAAARIGESLAGIAEILGKACERVGLAPAAPRRPAARAGAHASAPSRIGESLAETSVTGLGESIPSSALIQSPGSCFCTESAQSRYLMA